MPGVIASNRPLLSLGAVGSNPFSLSTDERNRLGFFTLWSNRGAGQTAGHCGLSKVGGSGTGANYQVTSGKTCRVYHIAWATDTANLIQVFQLYYNDAAVNIGTASSPTNPVYQFGNSGVYGFPVVAAYTWYSMAFSYEFPSQKYPGVQAATAPVTLVALLCREE